MSDQPYRIHVAGDIVVDHHLYQGERMKPTLPRQRGVGESRMSGGAAALTELLSATVKKLGRKDVEFELAVEEPDVKGEIAGHHAFALWQPFGLESDSDKNKVWRAQLLGYGNGAPGSAYMPKIRKGLARPDALVLDDAGFLFRIADEKKWWKAWRKDRPDWILLKMSDPIARGDLWHELTEHFGDRLICLVSAHDLRREYMGISRGLSWERAVDDLRNGLRQNPAFAALRRCRHLVVTLSTDGALWIHGPGAENPKATLCFDADGAEGERSDRLPGKVTGYLTAMSASLALHLVRATRAGTAVEKTGAEDGWLATLDLAPAIETGLAAMHDLEKFGHGPVGKAPPGGYPTERIAEILCEALKVPKAEHPAVAAVSAAIRDVKELRRASAGEHTPPGEHPLVPIAKALGEALAKAKVLPAPENPPRDKKHVGEKLAWATLSWPDQPEPGDRWTIIETSQQPPHAPASVVGLARLVAMRGPKSVLSDFPHAKFGRLITVDRQEIEALRSIRRMMRDYCKDATAKKPLSIGVFGPPGAGKSFGVKEIAHELFGKEVWLEFNLSQFDGPDELMGPFHQARDLVLSGKTPIVFWDEFDSREYNWLQYLLAPMQDGRFQEGQLNHAIGRCIFIFAGGTSSSFRNFGPRRDDSEAWRRFELRKGPDFLSRLDIYYDVLGPNPRKRPAPGPEPGGMEPDPDDIVYPLRRALLIRSHLGSDPDQRLDFDSDLLNALLLVREYEHGARSLEKLVVPLRPSDGKSIRRSALPSPAQLAMHVDVDDFNRILNRNAAFRMAEAVEKHAARIHKSYLEHALQAKEEERKAHPDKERHEPDASGTEEVRPKSHLNVDYDRLDPSYKEVNRAAARRIPDILALAGLGISRDCKERALTEAEIIAQIEHHLERLAEAEHDGWMDQKLANGWSYNKIRNDNRKHHNTLIPYSELPDTYKDNDRMMVRNCPKRVKEAGYKIVWLR